MYRVTNLTSATPTDTGSSTANDPTDTLATSTGGFAIGVAYSAENATPSASWTGVTETYDEYIEGTQAHSGGFSDGNAGTPLAITCNWATGSVAAGSFATWNDTAADPASGPANLKTYNTNALANIKTINTNAIANVKTLNTNA